MTDLHIKSGIHGAMIVYPRGEQLRPAREIVVVEDAVYGTREARRFIPGTDPAKTMKNDQLLSMFNGRLDNEAVHVNPGDLVRMYFVIVGPWTSAAHVIGSSNLPGSRRRGRDLRVLHSGGRCVSARRPHGLALAFAT